MLDAEIQKKEGKITLDNQDKLVDLCNLHWTQHDFPIFLFGAPIGDWMFHVCMVQWGTSFPQSQLLMRVKIKNIKLNASLSKPVRMVFGPWHCRSVPTKVPWHRLSRAMHLCIIPFNFSSYLPSNLVGLFLNSSLSSSNWIFLSP